LTGATTWKIRKLPSGNSWEDAYAEGIMGIRYYPKDPSGLISGLITNHEIARPIFSLFIDFEGKSSIKFGGYDISGVEANHTFNNMKSRSTDDWGFSLRDVKLGGYVFKEASNRIAQFNPAFPWIYLPSADWKTFQDNFNGQNNTINGIKLTCDEYWGYCRFKLSC
jgi:hypothetical protein